MNRVRRLEKRIEREELKLDKYIQRKTIKIENLMLEKNYFENKDDDRYEDFSEEE